jgi:pyruvate formate lyase activating enzyme
MKGLIFDIKRYAIHDGPGIRTTVFLKGCPMQCLWCHNPESQGAEPEYISRTKKLNGRVIQEKERVGKIMSTGEVMNEINKDKVFYEESGGGVTFSGGEPLAQPAFLIDILKTCKKEGIHTTLDTSGHANEGIINQVIDITDLFLYDLKLMKDFDHQKYTGVSNSLSLKNLDSLIDQGKEVIIRFPVVPGITDQNDNIALIAEHMVSRGLNRIDLLPYHYMAKKKYKQLDRAYELDHLEKVNDVCLKNIKEYFETNGLQVNLGG